MCHTRVIWLHGINGILTFLEPYVGLLVKVFAVNDIMAMGVIDAMREAGLRVPQDVSVMGFDDIQAASWPTYDLTTVAQPVDAMVTRALDLLFERIKDPTRVGEDVLIHGELRQRGSVRLP